MNGFWGQVQPYPTLDRLMQGHLPLPPLQIQRAQRLAILCPAIGDCVLIYNDCLVFGIPFDRHKFCYQV